MNGINLKTARHLSSTRYPHDPALCASVMEHLQAAVGMLTEF
jgi:hypothetical protein